MIDKNIFNEKSIAINQNFKTKEEIFKFLSNWFVENGYCNNNQEIYKGFLEREKESSTAFTDGLGIPHSKVNSIVKPGIFVLKNSTGIEWDSLDNMPTNFFIALAIPNADSDKMHLKMLSSIARKLVDKKFKETLLKEKTSIGIYELLSKVEII